MKNPHSKVATFVASKIDASTKSQTQIAAEAGFQRPNVVSMIKTGFTRLPIGRVIPFAKAIDADPVELFRLCMDEYTPDLLGVTDEIYGRDKLSGGEEQLLKRLRLHTRSKSFRMNKAVEALVDQIGREVKK